MMKAIKQFVLAIFILFVINVQAQIELSGAEINTVKEPQSGWTVQPPDTVNIDLNRLRKNDTLIISGEYRECGEWGGHFEHIYIVKKRNKLRCWLKIDPSCLPILPIKTINVAGFEKEKKNPHDTILLDNKEKKLIMVYFQEFGVLSVSSHGYSNAPTEFLIGINKKVLYPRRDWVGHWNGFTDLKEKLFSEK